jgi:hypothetical protein
MVLETIEQTGESLVVITEWPGSWGSGWNRCGPGSVRPRSTVAGGRAWRPARLSGWLYNNSHGQNQRDEQAFITASDLISVSYLTPQMKAALYEALAKIPGVTIFPDLVDLAGRPGVGVGMGHIVPSHPANGRTTAPADAAMIFDPTTYAFLGSGHTAQLRQAIVDQPGQQP